MTEKIIFLLLQEKKILIFKHHACIAWLSESDAQKKSTVWIVYLS